MLTTDLKWSHLFYSLPHLSIKLKHVLFVKADWTIASRLKIDSVLGELI